MYTASWQCPNNDTHKQLAEAIATFSTTVEQDIIQAKEETGSSEAPSFYIAATLTSGSEADDITLMAELGTSTKEYFGDPKFTSEVIGSYEEHYAYRSPEGVYPIKGEVKKRKVNFKVIISREQALIDKIDAEDITNLLLSSIRKGCTCSVIKRID